MNKSDKDNDLKHYGMYVTGDFFSVLMWSMRLWELKSVFAGGKRTFRSRLWAADIHWNAIMTAIPNAADHQPFRILNPAELIVGKSERDDGEDREFDFTKRELRWTRYMRFRLVADTLCRWSTRDEEVQTYSRPWSTVTPWTCPMTLRSFEEAPVVVRMTRDHMRLASDLELLAHTGTEGGARRAKKVAQAR